MHVCTCGTVFDITKDPHSLLPYDVSSLVGGGKKKHKGKSVVPTIINSLVNSEHVSLDLLGETTLDEIKRSNTYKKLSKEGKSAVLEKVDELIADRDTNDVVDKNGNTNTLYYICRNCGNYETIPEGSLLFTRGSSKESGQIVQTYKYLIHDPTLPITREYICPNKSCESNKDPNKKEAIFFRPNNGYKVVYVCKTCETIWS